MNESNENYLKISAIHMFRLLVILIWTQHTLLSLLCAIMDRLPIINYFSNIVVPFSIIVALIFALPYIVKKIKLSDFVFYIIILSIVLITLFFPLENANFIKKDFINILIKSVPLYFVGVAYSHNYSKNDLFYCSILSVIAVIMYQIYGIIIGREMISDNMGSAYNILPSIMYLIYWANEHHKIRYWIFVALGLLLLLSYGTRGPILAAIILILLLFFITLKHSIYKIVLLFLSFFVIILIRNLIPNFMVYMQKLFLKIGLSTRIFDFYIEGEISSNSGRDEISQIVINKIKANPLFGYGLMGDRVINNGLYAHNIFLELLCQFGIVIGFLLIISLLFITVKALLKSRKKEIFNFLLMLVCMVFIKLMLSGSYIVEPYLFFMLGLSISIIRGGEYIYEKNDKKSYNNVKT